MKDEKELAISNDIPEGWLVKELGEVANVNMGQSPSSTAYNEIGIGKYLIQGNADIKGRKTRPRIWTTDFPKTCAVGDIIMTVRAPVGAVARSIHEACIGRGVCAITTRMVNLDYLYHYLVSYETKWKSLEQGSTFTAVNGKDIRGIQVNVPPLAEQQKIAEILSTVDKKVEIISEQIKQTQELKKGLMQRLLTKGIGHTQFKESPFGQIPESWEIKEINEVTSYVDYRGKTPPKVETGTFLVTAKNIRNGRINYKISKEYVPTELYDEIMSRGKPALGDVLITTEAPLGEIAAIDNVNVALAQRVIKYRGIENVLDNLYLKYCFLSPYFQESLTIESTGSTVKGIKGSRLHKLKLLIPPINEQIKLAEVLSTIDDKIDSLSEKHILFKELKKGLMQQLLTGKLRVNRLIEEPELA